MKDSFNNILSKLVNSIDAVENEQEMLIRIAIGLAVFLILTIFRKQIAKAIIWLCTKTVARKSPSAQKALINSLTSPLSFFVFVLAVYGGTEIIAPSGEIREPVLVALKLGVIFSVSWFAINFINADFSFVLKNDDSKTKKTAVNFISNLLKIIIVLIAALLMLEQFGVSATRVFTALGIGGVAIAFACKDAVENLLSGFIIIYDKPFEVDDYIKISGQTGKVEEIKIRTTRLRMLDGSQIIYPNTTVANAAITNLSRMDIRLVDETLCIDYKHSGQEIEKLCEDLRNLIMSYEETEKDDVRVNFDDYGDNALEIGVFFYVHISSLQEFLKFKGKFNSDVKNFMDKSDIDLAFVSRTVYFGNDLNVKN